jgi:hypothetical protein
VDRLDRFLIRITPKWPWWAWPSALLVTGLLTVAVSWIFGPGESERVLLLGQPWGDTCAFLQITGQPCPQCGMTRSWIWTARGHFARAFLYSPGGTSMFLWLVVAGAIGGVRLLSRNVSRLSPHPWLLGGWTLFWIVFLYLGPWLARVTLGVNPLP